MNKRLLQVRALLPYWCPTLPSSCTGPLGLLLQLTFALGCAPREHARDETFRAMQVHEASLERAQARLAEAPCGPASSAEVAQLCQASGSLCALTRDVEDRDASTRCERASEACTTAREHRQAACARQPR